MPMLPRSLPPRVHPHGQGASLDFPVAGDQEERDTLDGVLADFRSQPSRSSSPFPPEAPDFSGFPQLSGNIGLLPVGDSHHPALYWSASQVGSFPAWCSIKIPVKRSKRAEHGPVQHHRGVLLAVLADEGRSQARAGRLKSTCGAPHCQSRPMASRSTNSSFGP